MRHGVQTFVQAVAISTMTRVAKLAPNDTVETNVRFKKKSVSSWLLVHMWIKNRLHFEHITIRCSTLDKNINALMFFSYFDIDHFVQFSCMIVKWMKCQHYSRIIRGLFYKHGLILTPACRSNCMPSKVWDKITYPFPNFNGCTVEVWEWISNFIHTLQ